MQDRYKFRAINMKTKEVFYIDNYYWFEENGVTEIDSNGTASGNTGEYWIDRCVGIKDVNNSLIFENDAITDDISTHLINPRLLRVVFQNGCFGVINNGIYSFKPLIDFIDYHTEKGKIIYDKCFMKVIGNSHENPELFYVAV